MLNRILRHLVFIFLVKPLAFIVLGLNIKHRERLPESGPAILVANHNSHLDTVVLMSLFPVRVLDYLRPIAAADYFLKNKLIGWFALKIVGIIPIYRPKNPQDRTSHDPLAPIGEALRKGAIVIFYPEGTRGESEQLAKFKSGIARLAEKNPDVPVYPIYLHGMGKSLPKGEGLFVPFVCDVVVGEKTFWNGNKEEFIGGLENSVVELGNEAYRPAWGEQ